MVYSVKFIFFVSFVLLFVHSVQGSCTFGSSMTGAWVTSTRGTLTFTSTTMTPWTVAQQGTYSFTCHINSGSIYVLKSDNFDYLGLTWNAYLCMDITTINTDAFYYYLGSSETTDADNERVKIFTFGATITQAAVCDDTNYTPGSYDVMVKSGSASSAASNCPASFLYNWMYSFDSGSGDQCSSGSYLDVCTDSKAMTFNYSSCSTNVAYSTSGSLYCINSLTSGGMNFLTLYNTDATTDESSTYRFTCMVFNTSSDSVFVTQYPRKCNATQTATSVTSPGASLVLQNSSSCNPTTAPSTTVTTVTASVATTTEAPVSSALAVGLGVTFALIAVFVVVGLVVWILWNKKNEKDKTRGDKDIEASTGGKGGTKPDEAKHDKPDGEVTPDVLSNVRKTPVSHLGEDDRPTTSGSIHVTLPADEDEHDNKVIQLVSDSNLTDSSVYNVVGVHPASEEADSATDSTPVKTFAPQKNVVPKGAVSLGNGVKNKKPTVPKRGRIPPLEGRNLPPIVEDATPRGLTSRSGSVHSRRRFGQRGGSVGVEDASTEEDLPGRPSVRRTPKPRPVRAQRGGKRNVPEKPEKKPRTVSVREHKEPSADDEDSTPTSSSVKVTRVNLTKETPKKSPRKKGSDMKVVDMESHADSHVSSDDLRAPSPEPSYQPSSLHLRGWTPDVRSIAYEAPLPKESNEHKPMLRDRTYSPDRDRIWSTDESPRVHYSDFVDAPAVQRSRPQSCRSRSRTSLYGDGSIRDGFLRPQSVNENRTDEDRPRSRSGSRGRKKGLRRSRSEVRPSSAPAYTPKSIMLDVEELPNSDPFRDDKVLAARSLAIDMEKVDVDRNGSPIVEKDGTKRGKDVFPKKKTRAKTTVSRTSTDRSLRFWVFFTRPIILLTRKFNPSNYMRSQQEEITDGTAVEDWSMRNPRSRRRQSSLSTHSRREPVKIEFGTADISRIRNFD